MQRQGGSSDGPCRFLMPFTSLVHARPLRGTALLLPQPPLPNVAFIHASSCYGGVNTGRLAGLAVTVLPLTKGFPEVPVTPKSPSNVISQLLCMFIWAFVPKVATSVLFTLVRR